MILLFICCSNTTGYAAATPLKPSLAPPLTIWHFFNMFFCSFCLLFLRHGTAVSVVTAFHCCLSINNMSGWFAIVNLSVWTSDRKSDNTLAYYSFTILGRVFMSGLRTFTSYSADTHNVDTCLSCYVHAIPASILYLAILWWLGVKVEFLGWRLKTVLTLLIFFISLSTISFS